MIRTKRDQAILSALAIRAAATLKDIRGEVVSAACDGEDNDGFSIKILESGLIAVGFATHNINGLPLIDGPWKGIRGFANLTKLDSGEPIAHTDEGQRFLKAYEN